MKPMGWMVEIGEIHLLLPNPHSRTRNLAQELRNWSDSTSIYDTPAANTDQQIIIKILVPKDIYNTFLRINLWHCWQLVLTTDCLYLLQTICVCHRQFVSVNWLPGLNLVPDIWSLAPQCTLGKSLQGTSSRKCLKIVVVLNHLHVA